MPNAYAMASTDQVAAVRAFVKRFLKDGYFQLYNNKRKTFRMIKWWAASTEAVEAMRYFCDANNIPYNVKGVARYGVLSRKSFYLYTDLAA